MAKDPDVIVIGAGAAGLGASITLARIGGRIFTLHNPKCDAPIELGAEFIHGRPPETWNLLKSHKIRTVEVDGDNWCVNNGRLGTCNFFSDVDKILKKMDGRKPDQSFLNF